MTSSYITQLIFSFIGWMAISSLHAQTTAAITLDSCTQWALENYPLTRQYDLLEQTKDLTVENLATGNLPRLQLTGQATYQSDVTEIPIMIPGFDIPTVSKDQYKVYGKITQPLTHFKSVQQEKELAKTNHSIQKQELAVSLRTLKDRVNSVFFSILLLEAQTEQSQITKAEIKSGLKRMNTALKNGTALPSDVNQLKVELLQLDQKIFTLESRRSQFIRMLSLITGHRMDKESIFQQPVVPLQPENLQRPEMELYAMERDRIDLQKSLFHQQIKPQLSFFIQGGYGRPSLNFLNNDFKPYYIGGLRFQWNISSYYTRQRKNEIWDVHQRTIDLKAETFTLNTRLQLEQYNEEIQRYRKLVHSDQEIIDLRSSIKETAGRQLAQGVVTPVDYLSFVYQEEQARQSSALHEIQLLQAYYNWLYENGN